MSICTRWWIRHYLKCQAQQTSRLTVRWPIISMSLPKRPVIAVTVDCSGSFAVTPRASTYILLFPDRCSRRADMFAVIAVELISEVITNINTHRYITVLGMAAQNTLG